MHMYMGTIYRMLLPPEYNKLQGWSLPNVSDWGYADAPYSLNPNSYVVSQLTVLIPPHNVQI